MTRRLRASRCEPAQVFVGGRESGREQLQRDVPMQLEIVGLIHFAHAAGAKGAGNLEALCDPHAGTERHDPLTTTAPR